ncbi:MAG: response regulator transcription factor [Chloroflexi bacterium]|nr:response regulator transcription factor [Chloroflexota bacterium]
MDKINVLIVDDHPLMRDALRDAVETEDALQVIGEAINGSQAVQMAADLKPDVILMDLYMPVMDGIEATREILRTNPDAKVLIITSSGEDKKVSAAVRAGAMGYLLKDASRDQILYGLKQVAQGKRFIPPEIGEKLARILYAEKEELITLTPREQEVLTLVGDGFSNSEIALSLCLSEATVRVHISNMLGKLELKNRSQVVAYAQKNKF